MRLWVLDGMTPGAHLGNDRVLIAEEEEGLSCAVDNDISGNSKCQNMNKLILLRPQIGQNIKLAIFPKCIFLYFEVTVICQQTHHSFTYFGTAYTTMNFGNDVGSFKVVSDFLRIIPQVQSTVSEA